MIQGGPEMAGNNEKSVADFCRAWPRMKLDELLVT